MITKWIKYRLALICKPRGNTGKFTITEYEPHEEITSLNVGWLSRFCMIIHDSNISRLWHVKAIENNQEFSQSHVAN